MKEVKIFQWCDLHWSEQEIKEAAEGTVTFGLVSGDTKPELHTMDLCAAHLVGITDTMKPWIEYSRPAELTPNNIAPRTARRSAIQQQDERQYCTLCDKSYTQRQGLISHVWRVHKGQEPPRQPAVCPTCHERYELPGMTMHRITMHGFDPLEDALKGAR